MISASNGGFSPFFPVASELYSFSGSMMINTSLAYFITAAKNSALVVTDFPEPDVPITKPLAFSSSVLSMMIGILVMRLIP